MFEFWRFIPVSAENYQLIEGSYDYFLIFLSYLISSFSAYALLVVLERAWQANTDKSLKLWQAFGSVVFGLGVWAMHFTGMLAFKIPIPMSFDIDLTVISVFTPMIGVYFALKILSKKNFNILNTNLCALYLALSIGSMHFIGMEAMMVEGVMSYHFILFLSSLGVAYILAFIAICLIKQFHMTKNRNGLITKILTSVVMGASVGGMHYVAMSAVSYYVPINSQPHSMNMHSTSLAFPLAITGIVFVIVATTMVCAMIEDKLQQAERIIEESAKREKSIVEHMADGLLTINEQGIIDGINTAGFTMFEYERKQLINIDFRTIMRADHIQNNQENSLKDILENKLGQTFVAQGVKQDGTLFPIEVNFSKITILSQDIYNCVARDITHRMQLEEQLRQSQKLESIGQLSAGIAHEINTPTQYIADNTMFLKDSFDSCLKTVESMQLILNKDVANITQHELDDVKSSFDDNDMDFILSEVPLAISQSIEGLDRVKNIIGAMKSFSHSNQGKISDIDLPESIESTVTVSRSEWRYLANLTTEFAEDLPKVKGLRDELNQVILNFIVNAAHTIEEKNSKNTEILGNIHIAVSQQDEYVKISISDDGMGMPDDVKKRIFDPFFTTKDVGKGTGQGLSMAYTLIVDKHNGLIEVESEINVGTTFHISLPIKPAV